MPPAGGAVGGDGQPDQPHGGRANDVRHSQQGCGDYSASVKAVGGNGAVIGQAVFGHAPFAEANNGRSAGHHPPRPAARHKQDRPNRPRRLDPGCAGYGRSRTPAAPGRQKQPRPNGRPAGDADCRRQAGLWGSAGLSAGTETADTGGGGG